MSLNKDAAVFDDLIKPSFNQTDWGNAQRMCKIHGHDLRFCHPRNQWLVWNGKIWETDNTAEITSRAKKTVLSIYRELYNIDNDSERRRLMKHAIASESTAKLNAMIESTKSEPGIPILPDILDKNIWSLPVKNGTLNLKTGNLESYNRDDYFTKIAHVEYDPEAKAPLWDKFLEDILPDKDVRDFLKRAVGYSLTGSTVETCMFILHGDGSNGKSTFIDVIEELLGDFAINTPIESLLTKKYDSGANNDIARMAGERFVSAMEADDGKKLAESLIKQVTGGDTVSARFLYQEMFQFKPQFKLFMGTNHKPVITGTDHAIWRRIKLIPFETTITKPDKVLKDKLLKELPGILNWAIEGCLEWQIEMDLGEPSAVQVSTNLYRLESDVLGMFLETIFDIGVETDFIDNKKIYYLYEAWCEIDKETPLKSPSFTKEMKKRGYTNKKKPKGMVWEGIKFKKDMFDVLSKIDSSAGLFEGCRVLQGFPVTFTHSLHEGNSLEYPASTCIPASILHHTDITQLKDNNSDAGLVQNPAFSLKKPTEIYKEIEARLSPEIVNHFFNRYPKLDIELIYDNIQRHRKSKNGNSPIEKIDDVNKFVFSFVTDIYGKAWQMNKGPIIELVQTIKMEESKK